MAKSILLVVLSVLAATTSAQLARAPERVRNNNAIAKSSSKNHEDSAFGRKLSSGLRGVEHRELQQSMRYLQEQSMSMENIVSDDIEPNFGGAKCSTNGDCGGADCKIIIGGYLCFEHYPIEYFCSGVCAGGPP